MNKYQLLCFVSITQEEEEKERRKNERFKEVNKRRKLELLQRDAEKRAKEFDKKVMITNSLFMEAMVVKQFELEV